MGQHPHSVIGANVTAGPWVVTPEAEAQVHAEVAGIIHAWEPVAAGRYRDRDGDVWEKDARGWRLVLQAGVEVEPHAVWGWNDGHVVDYAPFTPC